MANQVNIIPNQNVIWWTVPVELLQLTFSSLGLISGIVFLSVILSRHEFRQNLNLLLAVNVNIGGLIFCAPFIIQVCYMLRNDLPDRFCSLRTYFFIGGLVYTFQATTLQTVHRLFLTVFGHRRSLRNRWLFFCTALAQLVIPMMMLLPLLLKGHFPYIPDGKVCYISFNDLFGVLYPSVFFYFGPLSLQLGLSYWILQYISHETEAGRAQINIERRIQKERRTLIRLSLPVLLLVGVGLIYFVFCFGTWITNSSWSIPSCALHLSLLGISIATGVGMSTNLILHKKVSKIVSLTLRRFLIIRRQNPVHIMVPRQNTIHRRI